MQLKCYGTFNVICNTAALSFYTFFFLTTVKVLSIYSTTEKQQHQLFVSPLLELLKIKATYHFLLSFNAAKQERNPVWRSKNISV